MVIFLFCVYVIREFVGFWEQELVTGQEKGRNIQKERERESFQRNFFVVRQGFIYSVGGVGEGCVEGWGFIFRIFELVLDFQVFVEEEWFEGFQFFDGIVTLVQRRGQRGEGGEIGDGVWVIWRLGLVWVCLGVEMYFFQLVVLQ